MRTEVCKIIHDEGKVVILSKINHEEETSSTGEFTTEEEFQILGHACLGVLYFCDLYAMATGQSAKFSSVKEEKSNIGKNNKYDIWPV